MSYNLTVSLSEQTWQLLQQHAATTGTPPERIVEAAVQEHLAPPRLVARKIKSELTAEERRQASERLHRNFGAVDLGYAKGTGNESIDPDSALPVLPSPKRKQDMTDEEKEEARRQFKECIGSVSIGTGADNESIDADLAREYGDNHEPK